jgi:hypothetical protein
MRARLWIVLSLIFVAGCVGLPPQPADIAAKRFEAMPGQAVVYLFRDSPDFSPEGSAQTVQVDDRMIGSTYPGTYFRLELPPGRHRISGYGADGANILVDVSAGNIYFVQQQVVGGVRAQRYSRFRTVGPDFGRPAVQRSQLIATL